MTAASPARGRPLRFFGLLVAAWVATRVVVVSMPWAEEPLPEMAPPQLAYTPVPVVQEASAARVGPVVSPYIASAAPLVPDLPQRPSLATFGDAATLAANPAIAAPSDGDLFARDRTAAGHNLLWMAAMTALPLPRPVARLIDREMAPAPTRSGAMQPVAVSSRWHFDGWVAYRAGAATTAAAGAGPGLLGGSQAGAVATFRLAETAEAPTLLARVAASPAQGGRAGGAELAAGVRWRPLRSLPISLQAELRAAYAGDRAVSLRPAVMAVGGVDGARLPLKAHLRAYGAAGVVGGTLPTGFAEGHALAEREVARFDLARIDAGVGIWGAVQRDAGRLDAGPSVSLRLPVRGAAARLQLDYRVRIAGDATPGNGPALTLSTGF